VFSARAYVGVRSPSELLDRASLLTALAGEYGAAMDTARVAVEDKTEADREAQTALGEVEKNREAASSAKVTAEQAYNTAVAQEGEAAAEVSSLVNRRTALPDSAGSSASGPVVRPAVGRLTSTYGPRGGTIHFGIDIANTIGTPILSAMAGEVIDSGPASGFGLWVRVQHADGLVTVYGHINESLVSVGQQVAAGEQIATLGNRGESTGPHLHFEVHADGKKIDPLPWLRSNGVDI
jgi:murein DD-endopeptidase MepM/ murein hydrolase activator NlpD